MVPQRLGDSLKDWELRGLGKWVNMLSIFKDMFLTVGKSYKFVRERGKDRMNPVLLNWNSFGGYLSVYLERSVRRIIELNTDIKVYVYVHTCIS